MEVSALKDLELTTKEAKTPPPAPETIFHKGKKLLAGGVAYGTGRRKSSVARVWVRPGKRNYNRVEGLQPW